MDSRIIRTKKKLQDGLIDLLKQNSILDIRVSELCRTANVDRNTFYSHYSNISELKDDVLSVYTKKAIERIQANAPTYDFEGMLIETCRLIQEAQELTVLIYRSMLGPSDLLDLINACNEAVLSIFFMKNPSVEREKNHICQSFCHRRCNLNAHRLVSKRNDRKPRRSLQKNSRI